MRLDMVCERIAGAAATVPLRNDGELECNRSTSPRQLASGLAVFLFLLYVFYNILTNGNATIEPSG